MKPTISLKNNLSLQLVTFSAAIFSVVFLTAMEKANAQTSTTHIAVNSKSLARNLRPEESQKLVIAQAWSDLSSEQLSLATDLQQRSRIPTNSAIKPEVLSISDFTKDEQQLIAQVWSDLSSEQLSLATDLQQRSRIPVDSAIKPEVLSISDFTKDEQQLIAQVWSDLSSEQLSLATDLQQRSRIPVDSAIKPEVLSISPLQKSEQQLIAQVWSDLSSEQLSLATDLQQRSRIPTNSAIKPKVLSISPLQPNEQQFIAQTWADFTTENLSLATPNNNTKLIEPVLKTVPESGTQSEPVINPPDKREIAARIALKKVQIISPAPGVILDRSQNDQITIQYPDRASVQLKVNGTELDQSAITQRQVDPRRDLVTQTWSGANLKAGANTLTVVASKDGVDTETKREVVVKDTSKVTATEKPAASDRTASSSDRGNSDSSAPPSAKPAATTNKPNSDNKPQNKPEVKILTPQADAVLETIHSSIIIQYPQAASVILQVNGKSVDTAQVGRTEVNPTTKLVTQTWYGIVFSSGVNKLSILATKDGVNYEETSIQVTVPGKPEALKVEAVETEIPADGQSTATVQGGFVDKQGTITPWNEIITLNSSGGKFIGTDLKPDVPGFQVQPVKGEFTATLQAGYDAKTVRVQAKTSKFESYAQTKFKTTLREETLLTGFADLRIGAKGTNYYDNLREFLPDDDNGTDIDFSTAAFVSGSFGQWSYTGAYNNERALNEDNDGENRLFRTYSNDEEGYPIYGDSSTTEATTPSTDSVYLRLQRNPKMEFAEPDYFMWGDYNTEEFSTTSQEFSAISRQLHGFKSNYNLGDLQFNALVANNAEGFQRDTIAPDGTSGFYFLSRRQLVPGSEDVYLELSPLNDPGNVVSRQRLSLGTDYEIDYDRGTLLFNDPVLRTEIDAQGNILARRIVTTYQFESSSGDSTILAGRGRYHFNRDLENPTYLGATFLDEDRGDQDFSLWGVDGYVSLNDWGNITAEYAQSDNQTVFANANGSAYRLEGEVKFSDKIQGRAYYRQADEGFANNATLSFVPGQVRYGSQLQARIAEHTDLQLSYEHQDNNGVAPRPLDELEEFLDSGFEPVPGNALDNSLTTITAGVEQRFGEAELGVDLTWRDRSDRKSPGALDSTSTQLRSRFSIPLVDKLNFHALNDLTISDDTDAVFSDRIGLGLDYEISSGLSLVLNHQWFTKGNLAGESLTSLGVEGEYEPWANATLTGRYSIANGVDGINNIGSIGLQQKIIVAPGLNFDLDYEHTFSGIDSTGTGQQFTQPFSVGQSAASLSFGSGTTYGVGIEYTDDPDFTASARWQHSDNSGGGNTVISADVTGKLSSALTSLISFSQASSANQEFDIGTTRDLRMGLAYRNPKNDKFNALFRYEYEENGGLIPETILLGQGTGSKEHLFGIEGIYAPNWRWEFYGKYAFRNSETFIADDFVSSSNVSLGQLRATYRLNYNLDLVAEGRMIWQPSADYTESGFVLESGYYLTPELRLSAGYVFGNADDDDFTGTRSAGGPYVGLTVKLNSLLDGFGQHSAPKVPEGVSKKQERQGDEKIRGQGDKGTRETKNQEDQETRGQGDKGDKETRRQGDKEQGSRGEND